MYEFKFTLTENDYTEFSCFHSKHSPMGKKAMRFAYVIVFAVVALTLGVKLAETEPEDFIFMLVVSGCLFAFTFGLIILFTKLSFFTKVIVKLQVKLMKKSGKLPFDKENLFRFEDDYFLIETESSEIKQKYEAIENIMISPIAIYLCLSAVQGFILPLHIFESEQQKEEFLAFINGKTSQS